MCVYGRGGLPSAALGHLAANNLENQQAIAAAGGVVAVQDLAAAAKLNGKRARKCWHLLVCLHLYASVKQRQSQSAECMSVLCLLCLCTQ